MSLLGIDIGTTGCKAIAFDTAGKILAGGYRAHPLHFPAPGQCELDPEEVWHDIRQVICECTDEVGRTDQVEAVGFSVLGDSVTPLDAKNEPLSGTVIGAADRRAVRQAAEVESRMNRREIFSLTGAPLHAFCVIPKILWFRENRPEIFSRTQKFAGLQEYIHGKLGIDPRSDYSLAGRTMLLDIRRFEYAESLLEACGLSPSSLFPLARSAEVIGEIPRSVADSLGLIADTPVIAGGFDQACCALGAGVTAGTATLGMGTLEAVMAVRGALSLQEPLLTGNHGCNPHVVDGLYTSLAYVTTSGAVVQWFHDTLGEPERLKAAEAGIDSYEYMMNTVPEGPSRVFVLPYFEGAGTPWLDVDQYGSIFGLRLDTGRGEILKGILDCICYEVRLNIESLARGDIGVSVFRATGGGARSDRWLQLKADITGIPVERVAVTEAGCLGAAFLAGLGSGVYSSPEEIHEMVGTDRLFEPRPSESSKYEDGYGKYQELRERVRGLKLDS